jgi:signal transduction histidine kinase
MPGMINLSIEEIRGSPSVKEKLEVIQNSGRLFLNMINDILDFSCWERVNFD